jgi:protein-L-isoaspartate(D-aspartate) O-methyltransferase
MDYNVARKNMIERQIRPNKVVDEALIASIGDAPRERFLPEELRAVAYVDEDLRLSSGRNLMEPVVLARLLQALALTPADAVLDIASGTGYAAAVMARLAGTVFALESDGDLQARASGLFGELALDNIMSEEGDLTAGCPQHAPYNAILIEGAVDSVPAAILEQLAEGGRLAAVVMENGVGRATLYRKDGGHLSRRVLFDANVPALKEFLDAPAFRF